MVADVNHGPENLKRQAGQLPAQALNVKKDSRKAGKQETKKARKCSMPLAEVSITLA